MPLQSTVNIYNTIGFPGDIAFGTPYTAVPYNLVSSAQANTVGNAFSVVNGANPDTILGSPVAGTAKVGGNAQAVFAGILVNPKEYVTSGTTAGALNPTLVLPDNSIGSLMIQGECTVSLGNTANIGDLVYYDNTTGALGSTPQFSSFTAVVATNTMTVSAFTAGGAPIGVGSVISGPGFAPNTTVTALGTGTGGNGTYTVTGNATVASTAAAVGTAVAPTGKTLIANGHVSRYDVAATGLAVVRIG